jgi:hypothetical protein
MAASIQSRSLRAAAILNVALHAAALVLAALVLRPGTPAAPLSARVSYLAERPLGWTVGWLAWIACAAALAAFMILLARARPSAWTRAAAVLALLAAVIDVGCDVAYAWVLPARAAASLAAFASLEQRLGLASLTLANGLYSVAVLIATLGLPRAAVVARGLGVLTFVGGMGLAAAGVTGDPRHVMAGTAVTIPAFMAWSLAVSRRAV